MLVQRPFKPKLGLSREVEGVAGAQTGNTVRASLFQRPDPELGVRVYSLALAARARAHKAPTSSQRCNTHALLAAIDAGGNGANCVGVGSEMSERDAGEPKLVLREPPISFAFVPSEALFRAKPEAPHLEPVNPPGPTLGINEKRACGAER